MGGAVSYAAAAVKPLQTEGKEEKYSKDVDSVDWLNLPCPVKYEEIQRENIMSLKPELFEGLRFDFTKPLNQRFSLSHSLFMGSVEVPSQGAQIIKVPAAHYEFGANLIDQRMTMLIGRILTDGRMSARVKYDVTDRFSIKVNAQITNEPHFSQGMFHFDYRGGDYQAQLQLGNNAFYGFNYIQVLRQQTPTDFPPWLLRQPGIGMPLGSVTMRKWLAEQSVTPTLALGGEVFWLGQQRKSGIGFAGRYNTDKAIATAQIASTGILSLTYVQRVSDKVSLASDFLYNWNTKETTTTVGYDYLLRQCRLRGRLDTNGCVAAFLEERLNLGVNFLLSAEIDHWKKDYKFGFGMTVGE